MSPDFWALADKFIRTDSSRGNLAMLPLLREALAPLMKNHGSAAVTEQRFSHGGNEHANLLASFGPPGGLLLVTHSDTVLPGPPERWTNGPAHALTRDGDKVTGLGVADVKLDYLCKVFALRSLPLQNLKRPLHLLATGAEEVGLVGAKKFAESFRPEMALCGEPSELIPCHAHKGYAVVRVSLRVRSPRRVKLGRVLRVTGKAAHSSTPHLGDNAILKLLDQQPLASLQGGTNANTVPAEASAIVAGDEAVDAVDLSEAARGMQGLWALWCAQTKALRPERDEEFSPAEAVNNLGRIESHDDCLQALFDARLLPEHNPAALIASFAQAARVPAALAFEHVVERDNPGMRAKPGSPLLQALTRASGKTPKAKPTSTEAGMFFRAGVDAAVIGPGVSIGNAHTANEWNSAAALEKAVAVYTELIRELCF